ncbi:MAG: DUF4325 domain-containing protein [Thermoanaerobaculales bacterium]|nr:DUF4325 domain-containing protein [Thermoanaerobaculales bacterium]
MRWLIDQGWVEAKGNTRQRTYHLVTLDSRSFRKALEGLEEDRFWQEVSAVLPPDLPENVRDIWQYGFTEMVNNAIDHSEGTEVSVDVGYTAASITMWITDDGVGIFKKIQRELGLADERHAILELAKGKLTTDPDNHTGEGIFFASRMFDDYRIFSGEVVYSHQSVNEEDWVMEMDSGLTGTHVRMSLFNATKRTSEKVFDEYASEDGDYGFTKTVVPVRLLKHGPEKLVSRSQAKRLLARFDRFRTVILDFEGINEIGQAFADEVFRVFPGHHPDVQIVPIKMCPRVQKMYRRTQS